MIKLKTGDDDYSEYDAWVHFYSDALASSCGRSAYECKGLADEGVRALKERTEDD